MVIHTETQCMLHIATLKGFVGMIPCRNAPVHR